MIAGYDYLILRLGARRFWNRTRIAGASLVLAGGVLIGVGGAYYGYANNARADLGKYNVAAVELVPVVAEDEPVLSLSYPSTVPDSFLFLGDTGFTLPSSGSSGPQLPDGFTLVDFSSENPLPSVSSATSMSISAVEIDASVVELSIQDLGDRRAYQTPNNAVGHIPETADAGENGHGWYFGHTESPILDEGSVFFNLQQIPEKLLNSEEVQIITDNGSEQFLYRVTGTRTVHEDDLVLEDDGGAKIHLVSCVPRLVYDHRLIVDAELVATNASS